MQVLRTWAFVNVATLMVVLLSLLWSPPAKLAAEPSLRNYFAHTLVAGLAWLVFALVRFMAVSREQQP